MSKKYLLGLLLLAVGPVYAQSRQEVAVAKAAETLRQAMISGDRTALEDIVLPQLSYGHSGGHVDDKAEFVEKLASGKSDFATIDITGQTITVVKDVAILRHKLHAETLDKGVPGTVDLSVMLVWQKSRGEWRLLARQAVKAK
jgi:hypothetical protein